MSSFKFILLTIFLCISTKNALQQCCSDPIASFSRREFAGPCACQTISQKWNRYSDWIQLEGGYVHPALRLDYVHNYQGMGSAYYSFERGLFANLDTKNQKIKAYDTLLQVPITTVFSEFLVSKFIKKAPKPKQHSHLFPTPEYFMPDEFPSADEWLNKILDETYDYPSLDAWLAIGFAWLREYTNELLPYFELLPSSEYLPNTWSHEQKLELLNGTEALKHVMFADLLFSKVIPYIDMLGLTEQQVRDSFALLQSRAFGTDLSLMGGNLFSLFMCGIDLGNHMGSVDSSVHFGLENNEEDVDFTTVYWYIDQDVINGTEIFNNYGKHNSAEMFSLFGFIDDVADDQPNEDYYTFHVEVSRKDKNYDIKMQYFNQLWALQHVYVITKHPGFDYGNTLKLNGRNSMEIDASMLRRLRLTYVPNEYFDSFTISSILNDFETDYLRNIIDPLVIEQIHGLCNDLLMKYPTNYNEDETELIRIEMEKNEIITNLNTDLLSRLNIMSTVLRYRMREKLFLMKCFNEFEYDNIPCMDMDKDCLKWSIDNECDINPVWMHVHCAKSCNTCYRQTPSFKKKYLEQNVIN
eukprot:529117_1